MDIIIRQRSIVARLRVAEERRAQAESHAATQRMEKERDARASTEASEERMAQIMGDVRFLEAGARKLIQLSTGKVAPACPGTDLSQRLQNSLAHLTTALQGIRDAHSKWEESVRKPFILALRIARILLPIIAVIAFIAVVRNTGSPLLASMAVMACMFLAYRIESRVRKHKSRTKKYD